MSKLVEIGKVRQARPPDTRKPAGSAGLRNDSKAACFSRGNIPSLLGGVKRSSGWVGDRATRLVLARCCRQVYCVRVVAVIRLADFER